MAITDYSSLKTGITTWLDRSTDLDSMRDDFIDFAEAYFNRTLRTYQMMETTTLTTDSSGEASLPSDFLAAISVRYSSSPSIELKPVSIGGENRLSPYDTAGDPYWYSIRSAAGVSKLRVTPIKASASIVLRYFEKIPALTDANTTNWLLSLAPDIYLHRCLGEAWAFMRQFDRASGYYAEAGNRCAEMGLLSDLARYGNAEMVLDGVVA